MPAPDPPFDLTKLADRLRDRTLPLAEGEETRGWAFAILCEALLNAATELEDGFDPDPPSYPVGTLMTYNAPAWALPWAAQIVGVRFRDGLTEDQQRDLMRDAPNWSKGSTDRMKAVAGLYLTGSKTVYFRERNGDPYTLQVVTRTDETPNSANVQAALLRTKPVGIVLDYHTVTGWDYTALKTDSTTRNEKYSDLPLHYTSYTALSAGTRSA